ncbi:hypothetical protein OG874_31175 [Nocardia sp. NBC_00565]|nr:hypothetical protein [Nocardia sp. NBC_00565]WUC01244.1 hypothetical protein OG874_31175 [Nocardia sp. NBC_00565]
MSELSEYSIAQRFGEGWWPGDGWARIMWQRATRMTEPGDSEAQS